MNARDVIAPFTGLFIVGMIWLRTRMHYSRGGVGPLRLRPAGRLYFAAAVALLVAGWFVAPIIGRVLWPVAGATPTLLRVVWCLATYYIFIAVHRVLRMRGAVVFTPRDSSTGEPI